MTIKKDALAKGIKRVKSEGRPYVVIDITVMYAEAPTITTLAKDFSLAKGAVLNALLMHPSNEDARLTVLGDQAPEVTPPATDTDHFVRVKLIQLAFKFGNSASARMSVPTRQPFEKWTIVPEQKFLTLPLSDTFASLLDKSPTFTAREKQFQLAQVVFEKLTKALVDLKRLTQSAGTSLQQLKKDLAPFVDPCQKLDIAQKLMALMGAEPKGGLLPDVVTQGRIVQNKKNLDTLVALAHKHMLYETPVPKVVSSRSSLKISADQLEDALTRLVPDLKFYAANKDFAPPELHDDLQQVLTEAYVQLLATPLGDKIASQHILPAINVVCSFKPSFSLAGKISDPDFSQGLTDVPSIGSLDNAASVYGGMILSLGPQAVGNVPGPYSFMVSVAAAAQARIESVLQGNSIAAKKLGGKLLRFATIAGGFNGQRFDQVAAAIEANDFVKIRNLDWSKSFQSGPVISAFVSLFFLAALLKNVDGGGAVTVKRCADLLQPVLGAALGTFQALESISRLSVGLAPYKAGIQAGIPRLMAFAALVSGGASLFSEYFASDPAGFMLAGLGTTAALLSAAGFLAAAGTVLDGTIAGIPLGILLQVTGAVLGIITTIVSSIRDANAPGVFVVVSGVLDDLETINGPFQQVAISRPQLQKALDDLKDNMDDSHFVFIDSTDQNMILLADIGLAVEHIARIVDEDVLFVKAHLPVDKQRSLP